MTVWVDWSPAWMVMKHHSPEFRAEAVGLYRSRPGTTVAAVARDLGGNRRRCGPGSGSMTDEAAAPAFHDRARARGLNRSLDDLYVLAEELRVEHGREFRVPIADQEFGL
ncbi:transposase [Kutzneria kofuensis]|uniref:transposase n=1 Tax=Kutzneria kofuensis TaxID=103725 RepID=UPI0031E99591